MTRSLPLLAATLIVKNEARNLPGCLDALQGVVDEVVVYDTGSTDGTVALARAAGARVLQGYWDADFARARNAALGMTRARWALIVDADERLEADPAALRAVLAERGSDLDFLMMQVANVAPDGQELDSLTSTRIARRAASQWHGAVHEQLVLRPPGAGRPASRGARSGLPAPADAAQAVAVAGTGRRLVLPAEVARIRHHGYADGETRQAKSLRNLALAQTQLDELVATGSEDRDAGARVLLDLGRSLLGAGRRQEAVEAFEALRELVDGGVYRAQATAMLAQLLLDEGGFDEVALVLEQELRDSGLADVRFCAWLRAQALIHLGHAGEAVDLLREIDELVDPVGNRYTLGPVLIARALAAISALQLDEAGRALARAMVDHGRIEGHGELLLELWRGREPELAALLRELDGPYLGRLRGELESRSEQGRLVAAALR